MSGPKYHGWTHRPRELGGTDPIPGLWHPGSSGWVPAETIWVDSRDSDGSSSTMVLTNGVEYRVVVVGTWSYVDGDLPHGTPNADAVYPSHSRANTEVGWDADVQFASNNAGSYPAHHSLFEMDLGSGWAHEEPEGGPFSTPEPDHVYEYLVTGEGSVASFRVWDNNWVDNYGLLKVVVFTDNSANVPVSSADFLNHHARHEQGGDDAIKLDDLATPDDNTDLNSSTTRHGLLPKLGGGTSDFLRADGSWAVPPGGAATDEWLIQLIPFAGYTVVQGTFAPFAYAGSATLMNGWLLGSSGAQNDEVKWKFYITAGTWTIDLIHNKDNDRGIYTVYLGGSSVGTVDGYAAGNSSNNVGSISGVSVGATAAIELALKTETKNASSSAYKHAVQLISLKRTA